MPPSIKLRTTRFWVIAVGLGALIQTTPAATFVWDGGHASQDRWTANQNWNPNGKPDNDGTADLIFTGSIRLTPDANNDWSVNSISFDSAAGAFTIGGNALTIDGTSVTHAIGNTSNQLQTIANAMTLAANQTWSATNGALAFTGTVTLGSNALTFTGAADTSVTGAISGTGSLTKTGSGTLQLLGANSYSGGTTVSAGTLTGNSTSLQGAIANQGTVNFSQDLDGTYGGVISGAGSLVKTGIGKLTLGAGNTYTGNTTISGGTLSLGTANALHDTTAVAIDTGAALQLATASETVGSISGTGNIQLGAYNLTAGGTNASTSFSGVLSGSGGLVKVGSGTLTLGGANTYSGGTTVSAGVLAGDATSLQGSIANNASVVLTQTSDGSFSGAISGSGTFTKEGGATLTLQAANTYTGATQIAAGTLTLGVAGALADTTAVTVNAGAVFTLNAGAETVGSIAGAGSIDLGSHLLTAGGTGASTTFSGNIGGTGGLEKTGAGTLTLTGSNSFSGGTTVTAGTLQGTTTSLQGNIINQSAVTFSQAGDGTLSGVISGAGSVTKDGGGTLTLGAAQTYTGATNVIAGTLALGGNNTLSSSTAVTLDTASTLALGGYSAQIGSLAYHTAIVDYGPAGAANYLLLGGGGASTGTLTIDNFNAGEGDLFGFQSGAGGITGSYVDGVYFYGIGGGVLGATNQVVSGYAGTWDLIVADTTPFKSWDGGGGANTWSTAANWSGDTAPVSGFGLKLAFDGVTRLAPVMNSSYSVNTLRFESGAGAFTLSASGGGSTLSFGGSVPGIIQLSANAQTISAPLALTSTTIVETTGAGDLTLSGAISGAGGITKLGADTLVLSGGNSYAGATTINDGTVTLRHSNGLGGTAAGTTVSASATLALENGISVGAEALALAGTLRNNSGTNSYAGAISGAGQVIVDAGQLTLDGTTANTYTGLTTINSGTLALGKTAGIDAVAGDIVVGQGSGSATLVLNADNQIADQASVTLTSGGTPVFDLNARAERIGSLASANTAAAVTLGNGGSLITGGNNLSTTFAGVISESGSLTKEGTGTFTLSGANTYSGATTVAAGTLVLQHATALGTTGGGTTVASGAVLQLENNISVGAEALSLDGTLRSASGSNTYGGAISGGGGVVLDAGTLQLSGSSANSYTGTTTVNSGLLELNKTAGVSAVTGNLVIGDGSGSATARQLAANQMTATTAVTLADTGTVSLDVNGFAATIGSLGSANAAATVTLGAGTLTTGGNGMSTSFAGVISGSGGLTKAGTGTLTLSGTNTYTGATTLTGGTLALGASDVLANSSALSLGAGTTLSLSGNFSEHIGTLTISSATIDFGEAVGANAFLFDAVGAGSGTLTVANWNSTTDVFGVASNGISQSFLDNVYFANLNVGIGAVLSASPVAVGSYGNFYTLAPIPTFIWNGGASGGPAANLDNWNKAANWAGGIAPSVGAMKAIVMAGTVRTTTDMNGAYQINSLLFRSDAGAFTINTSTGDTLTIGGGGINNQSTALQTIAVPVALNASQTWTADAGAIAVSGDILSGAHTLTIAGGSDTNLSGIVGGGSGGLIKAGTGTLTLDGVNTYTGGTTLNAGTVSISSDANLGDTGGGMTFNGGTLRTTAGLSSARTVALEAAGGTIDTNGVNVTLSGALSGTGGLTKAGAGTLILTGTNSYTGGTTVGTGTLQGDTSSLTGNITNHATLVFDQAASGSFAGSVAGSGALTKTGAGTLTLTGVSSYTGATLISAGQLSLGTNAALSATTTLTVSSGATFDVGGYTLEIASLSGAGDVTLDGGTLTVGGTDASSTFSGTLAGPGVFAKVGAGDLAFDQSFDFGGELRLNGGSLTLAGISLTVGTLRISGDTVLDFGNSAATFLTAGTVIIENNAILTITNWVYLQDYFYASGAFYGLDTNTMTQTPVDFDVRGVSPQDRVSFTGFSNNLTYWDSLDRQITPAPEPATYGAIIIGASLALFGWRRTRRMLRRESGGR